MWVTNFLQSIFFVADIIVHDRNCLLEEQSVGSRRRFNLIFVISLLFLLPLFVEAYPLESFQPRKRFAISVKIDFKDHFLFETFLFSHSKLSTAHFLLVSFFPRKFLLERYCH